MFSSVWSFIKRHKRKFIFTGVVVGGKLTFRLASELKLAALANCPGMMSQYSALERERFNIRVFHELLTD